MNTNEISFENLPQAVSHLIREVAEIKSLMEEKQAPVVPQKRIPIGIEEACRLIGKAKPTVYALVRKRLLPCYKNGKKLYFFEDELLNWISRGKRKTMDEINKEAKADVRQHKTRQSYRNHL